MRDFLLLVWKSLDHPRWMYLANSIGVDTA